MAVRSPDGVVGVGAVGAIGEEGAVGDVGLPTYVPAQLPSQLLLLSLHHVGPQLFPPSHVQHPLVFGLGTCIVGDATGDTTGLLVIGVGTGSIVGEGLFVGLDGLILISAQFQN